MKVEWQKPDNRTPEHRQIFGILSLYCEEDDQYEQDIKILSFDGIRNKWRSSEGNTYKHKDLIYFIPIPEIPIPEII